MLVLRDLQVFAARVALVGLALGGPACAEPLQSGYGVTVLPGSSARLAMLCRLTSAGGSDVCAEVPDSSGDLPDPDVVRDRVTDLPPVPETSHAAPRPNPQLGENSTDPALPPDDSGR